MKRAHWILPFSAALLLGSVPALRAEEDAAAIIRRAESWQRAATSRIEMTMSISARPGDAKNARVISIVSYSRGDDDTHMEILEPKSIKGLRVLTLGGDTWIYFPSTGRVRRIPGGSRQESVQGVGGDFSYEDIGGGSLTDRYAFRLLSPAGDSWRIEGRSLQPESAYPRIALTVSNPDCVITRIEYFRTQGAAFKTLSLGGVKDLDGRKIATLMVMENLETGSRTEVRLVSVRYDVPLEERYFNPARFGK